MRIGVIKTDGGEHSAETLAAACASDIVSIDAATMSTPRMLAARRLETAVIAALVPHHEAAQDATKAELAADPKAHFERTDLHDPGDWPAKALADIQAAAKGTEWEADFNHPGKAAGILHLIGQYLIDTMHLERLYHRDRNPDDSHAKAYGENPTGIAVVPLTEG